MLSGVENSNNDYEKSCAKYKQACKLAPDIGHLSGKFEGFDWQILSLT